MSKRERAVLLVLALVILIVLAGIGVYLVDTHIIQPMQHLEAITEARRRTAP